MAHPFLIEVKPLLVEIGAISNNRKLISYFVKLARRKAMNLYKTSYIDYVSNENCWSDCIDIQIAGDTIWVMLHFNVGLRSQSVGCVIYENRLLKIYGG